VRPRSPLALALAVSTSLGAHAHGGTPLRRPLRPGAFSEGLAAVRGPVAARGTVVVAAAPGGRVRIPGATFTMGSDVRDLERARALCDKEPSRALCERVTSLEADQGLLRETPAHTVTVSAFELDRFEVTVEAYGRCVSAGTCAAPGFPPGDARFDRPELPVTHVSWDDAATFCAWMGGRLPTEAEWELAARGPTGRDFPWGWTWDGRLCNHGSLSTDETDGSDGFLWLAPVGSFPGGATLLGVHDLAGNVSEWVLDRFDATAFGNTAAGYAPRPVTNPRVTTGARAVVRGGSWSTGALWQRGASRWFRAPHLRTPDTGFRCAYDT
jgi:formylglycine-generating enzyme required for sulfatase activity